MDLHEELRLIIDNANSADLMEKLETIAINIRIENRDNFENALLMLAQESKNKEIRPVLYEIMVSLKSIWEKDLPKKGLQEKFKQAIVVKDPDSANAIYKQLKKQGLDYLSEIQKGIGKLILVNIGNEPWLLKYNKNELSFFNLQLNSIDGLNPILMPEGLEIVSLLVLSETSTESESPDKNDSVGKIWILLKDKTGDKRIFSISLKTIESLKADSRKFDERAIYLDREKSKCNHLSHYQDHLLILSKNIVFHYIRNEGWKEWYTINECEITAFAPTPKGFWFGHSDGKILILKEFNRIGVREKFQEYSESINCIRRQDESILIFGKNCFCVSDHSGNLTLSPVKTQCDIVETILLKREYALIHLKNGMLVAYELKQGNICWQINLGDIFEILLSSEDYIYCCQYNGLAKIFEIPDFTYMAEVLKQKGIYIECESVQWESNMPVKFLSDFIGRGDILQRIKDYNTAHFFIYSEPKFGKSSLLNVLPETLSEIEKCCYIDIFRLLKEVDSYTEFEEIFFYKCLGQYSFDLSQLSSKNGFHAFNAMIKLIKGARNFLVFCLDNFFIPTHFAEVDMKKFIAFIRDMFHSPSARVILTFNKIDKPNIAIFFENFSDIFNQRQLIVEEIPLLTNVEIKNALRKKHTQSQDTIDKIYNFTGNFPHLLHFYNNWEPLEITIENFSIKFAQEHCKKIFEYFRDLSPDAFLLLATFFRYSLLGVKHNYATFHANFPFLKNSLPREKHEKALDEIKNNYNKGFTVISEKEYFQISMNSNMQLFFEASRYIHWLDDFSTVNAFTAAPDTDRAQLVAKIFTRLTQSELDINDLLDKLMNKYKKQFSINKLTDKGRVALDMPLTTFMVIPLKPWEGKSFKRSFFDLYVTMQQFIQEYSRLTQENIIQKFYILLFELHGTPAKKIKEDLIGLERISIIEGATIKNIILDKSPREKAIENIFSQLSIKERSPYTTAGAVPDELFFGREMEMQLIRGLPENIGIFGTRTIGKTSLLRKLTRDLKPLEQWKVFTLDCARIESVESLLKNLAEKMLVSFETISDMEKFRKYVTQEASRSGQQFIFLLDEVDRLVEYDLANDEIIFNSFNRLCTEPLDNDAIAARFILFGFHQMFEQMKNSTSRLYNFMLFLPLKPLDATSALALVTKPIEKIRVRWKNKDEDAMYLVDSCSYHPRLLQAVCHSLLSILDGKNGSKDIIERSDVDKALTSAEFREICMRFYGNPQAEIVEKKKSMMKKISFNPFKENKSGDVGVIRKGRKFLNDLHRITILSAIRLYFQKDLEHFTINDIQSELNKNGIKISPDVMRIILDHLCLSGNFILKDETTLLTDDTNKILSKTDQYSTFDNSKLIVQKPDIFRSEKLLPKFKYEFGVKIFPRLLVAHFGGINQCVDELEKLIKKGDWQEWIERY